MPRPDFLDFVGISIASAVERLYDYIMSLDVVGDELTGLDVLSAMEALAARFDPDVDARILARATRLQKTIQSRTLAPLRAFDEMMLYQLTKASSTHQFLERDVLRVEVIDEAFARMPVIDQEPVKTLLLHDEPVADDRRSVVWAGP